MSFGDPLFPLSPQINVFGLIHFIREYKFLFDKLNIEFFSAKIYEMIDSKWLDFMAALDFHQLSRLPLEFDQYKDCPSSLADFFSKALSYSLLNVCCRKYKLQMEENVGTPNNRLKKVKAKKVHEFAVLSELIKEECGRANVSRIVDIGCGLGNLGRFMQANGLASIDYVGIEANSEFCHSGQRLNTNVRLENISFSDGTLDECRRVLVKPNSRTAIVSLHGCGELQNLILREFTNLAKESGTNPLLISIGCCYHKLKNWDDKDIERWMLSKRMRKMFRQVYGNAGFPIPGLRLACQAKLCRWIEFTESEHLFHQHSFANRAYVECLRLRKGYNKKAADEKPRKLNRNLGLDRDAFRSEVMRRSDIPSSERQQCELLLDEVIAEHELAVSYIEPFTTLQFALQNPLESLVLLDRLFYARECGFDAELVELFDASISPRNICLVARIPS